MSRADNLDYGSDDCSEGDFVDVGAETPEPEEPRGRYYGEHPEIKDGRPEEGPPTESDEDDEDSAPPPKMPAAPGVALSDEPRLILSTDCRDLSQIFPANADPMATAINYNPLLPQFPMRLAVIGPSGGGKTTIVANILRLNPVYEKIFAFCRDEDEPFYKALKQDKRCVLMTASLDDLPAFEELKQDPSQKIFILDDVLSAKNQQPVIDAFIMGRKAGCSMIYLSQSFFGIPLKIRQQLSDVMLTRNMGNSKGNLERIAREFAGDMAPGDLVTMYKRATRPESEADRANFMWINLTAKDPLNRYRRGFGVRMVWVPIGTLKGVAQAHPIIAEAKKRAIVAKARAMIIAQKTNEAAQARSAARRPDPARHLHAAAMPPIAASPMVVRRR